MTAGKNRNVNLDIIRSFAFICVIYAHFYIYAGFPASALSGWADTLRIGGWIINHACIPVFILLSGYLCGSKKPCAKYYLGLIRILLVYLLCALLCLLYKRIYFSETMSLRAAVSAVVNFQVHDYVWYVQLYFGLFLMIPFLNLLYHSCGSKKIKLMLIASFAALSILPSFLNQFIQIYSIWWMRLFPIPLYFVGMYLKEYSEALPLRKLIPAFILVMFLFSGLDMLLFSDSPALLLGVANEHYQIFVCGIFIFLIGLNIPSSKMSATMRGIFAKVSDLSYGAYLLSWISDSFIANELTRRFGFVPLTWGIVQIVCSFLFSLALAQLVDIIYKPLGQFLSALLSGLCRRLAKD